MNWHLILEQKGRITAGHTYLPIKHNFCISLAVADVTAINPVLTQNMRSLDLFSLTILWGPNRIRCIEFLTILLHILLRRNMTVTLLYCFNKRIAIHSNHIVIILYHDILVKKGCSYYGYTMLRFTSDKCTIINLSLIAILFS